MKLTITLGQVQYPGEKISVPFWFPGDRSFHLNATTAPKINLDTNQVSLETLKQIRSAITNNELAGKIKDVDKAIAEKSSKKEIEIPSEPITEEKKFATPAEVVQQQSHSVETAAKEIISMNVKNLTSHIGDDVITNSLISKGVSDLEILYKALEYETLKPTPRKSVITVLEARIAAVESIGVGVGSSVSMEVEETDYAKIEIDTEQGIINTIEILETEVKSEE